MAVNQRDEPQVNCATEIYQQLVAAGIDVLYDDRQERPGVKFKDADLIGYPARVVIGKKAITEGLIEVKWRSTGEMSFQEKGNIATYLKDALASMM